jgi:hypothetical protein
LGKDSLKYPILFVCVAVEAAAVATVTVIVIVNIPAFVD